MELEYHSEDFSVAGRAYVCRRCDASFQARHPSDLHNALMNHKANCADAWKRALAVKSRKVKTPWACPLCTTTIRARQSLVFLLEVVRAHVAGHASEPAPHRCQLCRGTCEG